MTKSMSLGPIWGENINLWFLGPIESPPPIFLSSSPPWPAGIHSCPRWAGGHGTVGLWGLIPSRKIWRPTARTLKDLSQEECRDAVCMLPFGGLCHQPQSPPWIWLLTKKILYFQKIPLTYGTIGLIFFFCSFNDMPDYLFFQRIGLRDIFYKK